MAYNENLILMGILNAMPVFNCVTHNSIVQFRFLLISAVRYVFILCMDLHIASVAYLLISVLYESYEGHGNAACTVSAQ